MIEKILEAQSCSDVICVCANSIERGRGLTHCPAHDDRVPSLNVELGDKGVVLHCHSGCKQEDVIAALKAKGVWNQPTRRLAKISRAPVGKPTGKLVAEYEYVDREGNPLFVVERYEPKDFRQRRADGQRHDVSELWTLYHLPEVIAAVEAKKTVYITEGEKDADELRKLGVVATSAPGGAGKWRDEYAQYLIGADVIVCQDRDPVNVRTGKRAGEGHARQVAQSLSVAARSVKILEFPGVKDAAEWCVNGSGLALHMLVSGLPEWHSDEKVMRTPSDLAREYLELVEHRMAGNREYIGWLPGYRELDKAVAYFPGDLWLIAAATGVGKSTMLQSLQRRCPVPSVYFSIEMSWVQLVDRLIAAEANVDSWQLARGAISKHEYERVRQAIEDFSRREDQILVDSPGLNTSMLETLVRIARVRFGTRVIFVDYAQRLTDRAGDGEYERVSKISNNLARIARETGTTLVSAAQVNRKGARNDGDPPSMKDIRDSGYLEQDASVVLTIGRKVGETLTKVFVAKNRNGAAGFDPVELTFDAIRAQLIEPSEARRDRARPMENG